MLNPNFYIPGSTKSPLEVGDKIPEFSLQNYNGELKNINPDRTFLLQCSYDFSIV